MRGFLEKKSYFFFGTSTQKALLVYKKKHSNLFLTLMDLKKKVIVCKTSGIVKVGDKKKQKISPQSIELIVNKLISYLQLYAITTVIVLLKVKPTVHVFNLVRELTRNGIKIESFIDKKRKAHNGQRGRNLRRI